MLRCRPLLTPRRAAPPCPALPCSHLVLEHIRDPARGQRPRPEHDAGDGGGGQDGRAAEGHCLGLPLRASTSMTRRWGPAWTGTCTGHMRMLGAAAVCAVRVLCACVFVCLLARALASATGRLRVTAASAVAMCAGSSSRAMPASPVHPWHHTASALVPPGCATARSRPAALPSPRTCRKEAASTRAPPRTLRRAPKCFSLQLAWDF
jgi:hypothetical protein